jgi:hypothetical protein
MGGITSQDNPAESPFVTASCSEPKWARAQNVDAVFGIAHSLIQSIATSWMGEIWIDDLLRFLGRGHVVRVFSFLDHKLKSPESIGRQAETSTNSRTFWVTKEGKIFREEEVIHLQGSIAKGPQRKVGMGLLVW